MRAQITSGQSRAFSIWCVEDTQEINWFCYAGFLLKSKF